MTRKNRMTRQSHGGTVRVDQLLADIRGLILAARRAVVRSVDTLEVLTSFEIGRRIVEHEQQCAARAEYEKRTLGELAERLTEEFGRGFSRSNLEYMRKLFLAYRNRLPGKSQMVSGKLQSESHEKSQTLSGGSSPGKPSVSREGAQAGEKGRRRAGHRHHPLQEKARGVGHNHFAQECQHPRQGIPTNIGVNLVIIYLRKGGQGLKRGRAYVQGGLMAGWEKVQALQ